MSEKAPTCATSKDELQRYLYGEIGRMQREIITRADAATSPRAMCVTEFSLSLDVHSGRWGMYFSFGYGALRSRHYSSFLGPTVAIILGHEAAFIEAETRSLVKCMNMWWLTDALKREKVEEDVR